MAKQGFRVMDSDLHVIEPRTLWEDYSIDSFLALPHLSFETKRKVLWDNCARLYNLQPVGVESPGGN